LLCCLLCCTFVLGKGIADERTWRSVAGSHDRADAVWLAEIRNPVLWLNSYHCRASKVYIQLVLHVHHQYPSISSFWCYYLRRRLVGGEGIASLSVTQSVCVPAELRLHAALISVAKVMRCILCSLVAILCRFFGKDTAAAATTTTVGFVELAYIYGVTPG